MNSTRKHAGSLRTAVTAGIIVCSLGVLGGLSWQSGRATQAPEIGGAAWPDAPCGYCGVVEQVREIVMPRPGQGASTIEASRDEAVVLLLIALSGRPITSAMPKIYEVNVRMDDGSVRSVREAGVPHWKAGDRVKVFGDRLSALS